MIVVMKWTCDDDSYMNYIELYVVITVMVKNMAEFIF